MNGQKPGLANALIPPGYSNCPVASQDPLWRTPRCDRHAWELKKEA